MGAKYPSYILVDSREVELKEAEVSQKALSAKPTREDVRQGFVLRRCAYITSGGIANNSEIDIIWLRYQETLAPLLGKLNKLLGHEWHEWEIPPVPESGWPKAAREAHSDWLGKACRITECD